LFNIFKTKEKKSVTVTDDNWNEWVSQSKGIVMVDVWAPWCMPCKIIGPVVEELADEYEGRVVVGKLNSDENQKSHELGIRGIPTLLFFKDGKRVDQIVGAQPMNVIREKLDTLLNK